MTQISTATFDLWQTLIIDTPELGRPRAECRLQGVLEALNDAGHKSTMDSLTSSPSPMMMTVSVGDFAATY